MRVSIEAMKTLTRRVALVTGASGGIGHAVARGLAVELADLALAILRNPYMTTGVAQTIAVVGRTQPAEAPRANFGDSAGICAAASPKFGPRLRVVASALGNEPQPVSGGSALCDTL
jgi:NAD(P)-dependent dehydrogenase (short-subunit alcohol dehydrogenase family)